MQTEIKFVTFEPTEGHFCTDIYRNGLRILCGPSFLNEGESMEYSLSWMREETRNPITL